MKKLRLILTYDCNRKCKGCCNTQPAYQMQNVPKIHWDDFTDFIDKEEFNEIILTGGEPMLYPNRVTYITTLINSILPKCKVILYTAYIPGPIIADVLNFIDGLTITLHEQKDLRNFLLLVRWLDHNPLLMLNKSLRVNIFAGIKDVDVIHLRCSEDWKIKDNMKWIPNCPLPEDEQIYYLDHDW